MGTESEIEKKEEQLSTRCAYIIPKKKRPCKMFVKVGQRYCGEHACFDPENEVGFIWN